MCLYVGGGGAGITARGDHSALLGRRAWQVGRSCALPGAEGSCHRTESAAENSTERNTGKGRAAGEQSELQDGVQQPVS